MSTSFFWVSADALTVAATSAAARTMADLFMRPSQEAHRMRSSRAASRARHPDVERPTPAQERARGAAYQCARLLRDPVEYESAEPRIFSSVDDAHATTQLFEDAIMGGS